VDALSELVSSVRARTASWRAFDARAPWGVALGGAPAAFAIHHVATGAAVLSLDDAEPVRRSPPGSASIGRPRRGRRSRSHPDPEAPNLRFDSGHALALTTDDVVLVPHGRAHALRDRADTPVVALEALLAVHARGDDRAPRVILGGAGSATQITSVTIELDDPFRAPLVSSLPPVVRLAGATHGSLVDHLRLVAREIETRPLGADLVLARMADVLFVHAMRAYVGTLGDESAQACRSLELARALRDPGVATALGLMSGRAEHPWTVASLAAHVGLSRSVFAARFTRLVGEPPLGFLTRMRMQRATMLLREGATLAQASQLTGYASEASFSHAFRQWAGVAPGTWRRKLTPG